MIIPSAVDFLGREIISNSLWKIIPEEGLHVVERCRIKSLPRNERPSTHLQIRIIRKFIQIPRNSENILIRSGRSVPGCVIHRKQTCGRDLASADVRNTSLSKQSQKCQDSVIGGFLNMDMELHSPYSAKVCSGRDDRNVFVQVAWEAIAHRADNGLTGVNVLVHPIVSV